MISKRRKSENKPTTLASAKKIQKLKKKNYDFLKKKNVKTKTSNYLKQNEGDKIRK